MMHSVLSDFRYALRTLRRSPGFAVVAVLTLALGIGATTAVFTVVNGVLLRPLPYADPDRLALVWISGPATTGPAPRLPLSAGVFTDARERVRTFDGFAAFRSRSFALAENGEAAEQVRGAGASAGLFEVLGVKPRIGRTFSAAEDRPGAEKVVVLSDALWRRKYGASPSVLGRQITLSGDRYTVIGVMPPGFAFPRGAELPGALQFPARTQLWTPMAFTELELSPQRKGTLNLAAVARLRPGVTPERAEQDLSAVSTALRDSWGGFARGYGMVAVGLREQGVAPVRSRLLLLLGAVALVLLIACANVANLLVARTAARRREMAVRSALGAGRGRLVRQMVAENVVLAAAGAVLGAVLAMWGKDAMLALVPGDLPRADDVVIDARVLAATLLLAVAAGVAFGVVAAAHAARARIGEALSASGTKVAGGPRQLRMRRTLVAAEVALSLMLLVGAGLLGTSFARLQRVPPGFEPAGAITGGLLLPFTGEFNPARDGARWRTTFDRYLERVRALPGVRSAGGVSSLPLTGAVEFTVFAVDGRPRPASAEDAPSAAYAVVTPGYFEAAGMQIRQGRPITDADRADAAPVVVVNEALARKHWPGESAVGKRITIGFDERVSREVVGVVGDVKLISLDAETTPAVYFPLEQVPYPFLSIVVRTQGAPAAQAPALRGALRETDPALAFDELRTLDDVFAASLATRRFSMVVLGFFAALAMLLAMVGLYGVISYAVAQRTREIGVRMALGARPEDVARMVLGESALVVGAGLAAGVVGALLLTRLLRSQLYAVSAADPSVYAAVALSLAAVAMVAAYIPARRATKVDPMVALREE
ncbi:MAG TPA: ABC transporter permease [Gemmatimonadaceae bacterium]|nr:ABC transporter permease [Gemmatimonadaceae bacterium]